jgi:hypothetical protein
MGATIAIVVVSMINSCNVCPDASGVRTELVMDEGTRIEAAAPGGRLSIVAGAGNQRRYEWDGCGLDAHPCARTKRWYGSLGIYDPAPGFAYLFSSCNGISRPVVGEGQIHFADQVGAEAWLDRYARVFPETTVWTNDGLVIRWGLSRQRSQLNADVWQICIAGERTSSLAGAKDQAVTVIAAPAQSTARSECVQVSAAVMAETREVWAKHWRQADEWAARRDAARSAQQ